MATRAAWVERDAAQRAQALAAGAVGAATTSFRAAKAALQARLVEQAVVAAVERAFLTHSQDQAQAAAMAVLMQLQAKLVRVSVVVVVEVDAMQWVVLVAVACCAFFTKP